MAGKGVPNADLIGGTLAYGVELLCKWMRTKLPCWVVAICTLKGTELNS